MTYLFAVISLILGLHFFSNNLLVSIVLTLLFVIFVLYRFSLKKSVLLLSLFLSGVLFKAFPRTYNNPQNIYSGVVVSSKENYFLLYSHGERFYVYEKDNDREIGDILVVQGEVTTNSFTTHESQSDFNEYLSRKGCKRSISSEGIYSKFRSFFRLKNAKSSFLSMLNSNAAPLVDAMVFNTKDYSSGVIQTAEQVQLIFLLSTAGIYFSFFIRLLKKVIYLKCDERESHLLSLLICSPYVVFSFPKVGVLRVFLVNLLSIPKKDNSSCKLNYLQKISITHILILVLNPYWAYDSGFLIGFALTISLYFFRISYKTKMNWKSHLVTPALVYLFIQPFATFRSGNLHLFTFFEQILLIPVNELFIVLSLLGFAGVPLNPVLNFFGNFIYESLKMFEQADLKIPLADYGSFYIAGFYILFFIALYLFESKRYRHLRYTCFTALGLLIVGLTPIQPILTSGVYFVNVGQGDSIVIQDHFHTVMIDTGGNLSFDMAKKTLIPFLNKKHIYHLDALITTHDDFDHSGAAESLIKNFPVRSYLTSDDDFPFGVGRIHLENLNHYEAQDENESSLVLYLDFCNKKYLFMGDAPKEIETQIIKDNPNLRCDILKVGHHGSKTSSDDTFIRTVQPKEGIISCGRNNRYGHPNKEVIDTLYRYDVKIRRTDIEGTISYLSYLSY